jgi:hypothetical protein
VLAIITGYYAKQTRRLAEGQDQLRRDALRPIVYADLDLTSPVGQTPNPRITLRNVGAGPAVNVGLRFDNPAGHRFYEKWVPAISAKEGTGRIDLQYHATGELIEGRIEDISTVVVEYDDVFGTHFRTRARTQQQFMGWQNLDVSIDSVQHRTINAPIDTGWTALRLEREAGE